MVILTQVIPINHGDTVILTPAQKQHLDNLAPKLPSGKRLHNYGTTSPCYQWETSLFQWPFSIAMLVITRG